MFKITSKGQVTIPKEMRDLLGLLPGTMVKFEIKRNTITLVKGRKNQTQAIDRWVGTLPLNEGVDHFIDASRGKKKN